MFEYRYCLWCARCFIPAAGHQQRQRFCRKKCQRYAARTYLRLWRTSPAVVRREELVA
jgi:uncharacterized protein YbdZ (MbtH family)